MVVVVLRETYLWSVHVQKSGTCALQSDTTEEENGEHDVWKESGEVHDLKNESKNFDFNWFTLI